MPFTEVHRPGQHDKCWITSDKRFALPQKVLERCGWQPNHLIHVACIPEVATVMFKLSDDDDGYTLSPMNRNGYSGTGGLLSLSGMINDHLKHQIKGIPLYDLEPIYLPPQASALQYQLALMLKAPDWQYTEFSKIGMAAIPPDMNGVYVILDSRGTSLRYGQGKVRTRQETEHLQEDNLRREGARLGYFPLEEEISRRIMELGLICRFEQDYGKLPKYNPIRA